MIPYQELCDALAQWRARNGLTSGPSARVRFQPAATVVTPSPDEGQVAFVAAAALAQAVGPTVAEPVPGQGAYGDHADGDRADGGSVDGDTAFTEAAPADPVTGEYSPTPAFGEAALGQAAFGQAAFGEAPLGEAPLGGAAFGEAPLGEAPLGEAPLEETPAGATEPPRDPGEPTQAPSAAPAEALLFTTEDLFTEPPTTLAAEHAPAAPAHAETYDGSVDEIMPGSADDVTGEEQGEQDAPTTLHLVPDSSDGRDVTSDLDLDSAVVDEEDL
jgi:hypothetical protein